MLLTFFLKFIIFQIHVRIEEIWISIIELDAFNFPTIYYICPVNVFCLLTQGIKIISVVVGWLLM